MLEGKVFLLQLLTGDKIKLGHMVVLGKFIDTTQKPTHISITSNGGLVISYNEIVPIQTERLECYLY